MSATAAPAHFPYRDHRNMAQVMSDEVRRRCPKCGVTRLTGCAYSTCPIARDAA